MASQYVSVNLKADAQHLATIVNGQLRVRELAGICSRHGLGKSGVKADLQRRVLDLISRAARSPDPQTFADVKKAILDIALPGQPPAMPAASAPSLSTYPTASAMSPYGAHNGHGWGQKGQKPQQAPYLGLYFKPSPFYEVEAMIGEVKTLDIMSQHRQAYQHPIKATAIQQCLTDPSLRVMVFCAASNSGVQDISFPHQCEIKVNGGEVKANLRGLKGKPGSTRPVDITDVLRLKPPNYENRLDFTWALTSKGSNRARKFYLGLYLCKTQPVDSLVRKIGNRARISKASVIQEVSKQAQDSDIQATSQVLSLRCPLSYMRLDLPVRSVSCKHISCFDATSYLQLQEQGPQWLCPICNKPALFDNLAVDEYVRDILANTSKCQEQVTIDLDGQWHANGAAEVEVKPDDEHDGNYLDDEDDDALIISDVSFISGRSFPTPSRSAQPPGTPIMNASGEGSSMPRPTNKRSISQVIDLTLSDDDEPFQPTKRQNTGGVNGFSGFSMANNPWR